MPVAGLALLPFVFVKSHQLATKPFLINHERIHLRQQAELLWLPFLVLYFLNYGINLLRYRNRDLAYRNIVFEREAYEMDKDLNYLQHRKLFAFMKFVRQRQVS